MRVLCGYFDLNTRICGSTRIYAGMLGTLLLYLLGAQLYLPGAGPPKSLKGGREGGALPRTAHRSGGYLGQSRPDC